MKLPLTRKQKINNCNVILEYLQWRLQYRKTLDIELEIKFINKALRKHHDDAFQEANRIINRASS